MMRIKELRASLSQKVIEFVNGLEDDIRANLSLADHTPSKILKMKRIACATAYSAFAKVNTDTDAEVIASEPAEIQTRQVSKSKKSSKKSSSSKSKKTHGKKH